jgi:hypothetical protein
MTNDLPRALGLVEKGHTQMTHAVVAAPLSRV